MTSVGRECDGQGLVVGRLEAMLAVTRNKEAPDCECLSANSRLINFSCNSSKRIEVS